MVPVCIAPLNERDGRCRCSASTGPFLLQLPSLQKCVVQFLVKFDLEFDLEFEISDGKILVKFGGRTFLPAGKAREVSGRISGQISGQILENISATSFQTSRRFSETSFSRRAVLTYCEPSQTTAGKKHSQSNNSKKTIK